MTASDLEKLYGRSIKPGEFGRFLGVDARTVIKYADRWGGVEVAPGCWRFFEKRIEEVINAGSNNETREDEVARKRDGRGCSSAKAVPGRVQEIVSGSRHLGKRNTNGTGKGAFSDKHGVCGD